MKKTSRSLYAVLTAFAGILLLSLAPALADHSKGNGKGHDDDDDDGPNRRNSFRVEMSGDEEVPAVLTNGEGLLTLKVDGNKIDYEIEYKDLRGGAITAAHLHFGQEGVNGGVIAFLCGGGGKPACPVAGTKLTGMLQASDIQGPAAQGIAPGNMDSALIAIRKGLVYANAHNAAYMGGEIRGQVK